MQSFPLPAGVDVPTFSAPLPHPRFRDAQRSIANRKITTPPAESNSTRLAVAAPVDQLADAIDDVVDRDAVDVLAGSDHRLRRYPPA